MRAGAIPEWFDQMSSPLSGKASTRTLALGALGVVFGDIGTSPLYTMKEVFGGIICR